MRIFITGAPGTNKFVLSVNVSNKYGLDHFSFRSLVLDYIKSDEDDLDIVKAVWSKGAVFPPELAFKIISKYMLSNAEDNYVLDGYPKGAIEAKILKEYLLEKNLTNNNYSIILNENIKNIYSIMEVKLICLTCPYMINTVVASPILEQKCPYCHSILVKGNDKVYSNKTQISESYRRYKSEYKGIFSNLKEISKILVFNNNTQSEIINTTFEKINKYEHRFV
ncbi:MAG: nucleoside monophosphate kinase [Patescibacteria group bacterium]